MAFSVSNEMKINLMGDTPGKVMYCGDGNAASVTTAVLCGSTYGIRKIDTFNITLTSGTGVSAVVKSYDYSTYDADILTLTCTANDTFHFQIIGSDNGN